MEHELGDTVVFRDRNDGLPPKPMLVIGRAEYVNAEPSYLLRYRDAKGDLTEQWWTQGALRAAA